MSDNKVADTFDQWADSGDDARMEDGHGDVVKQVVERMQIGPGERILDLGCGNGWATRMIAKINAGVQAIGVDCSPKMIARADELHSYTIRARYDFGSFENLEFKDGEFDRVFSMEALYYSTDLPKALSEAFRVTKPGGKAEILVDYFTESGASADWSEGIGLSMQRLDEAGWTAAFETAGYTGVSTERVIDSRAPKEGKEELHAAGTLWIRANKA
jgi:ubiquinone/menaquinone biosynthesis C-methylase UbiE